MSSLSAADGFLRITTVFAWIPAIGFLIPYGVIAKEICPSLGLVPMTLSACYGLFCLWASGIRYKALAFTIEAFLAAFLIGILIPGWVAMAKWRWNRSEGLTMVGTYGTVPLMISFCIHAYYALRHVYEGRLSFSFFTRARCAQCQRSLAATQSASEEYVTASEGRCSYTDAERAEKGATPRASSSKEPRPSTDDESAPLM